MRFRPLAAALLLALTPPAMAADLSQRAEVQEFIDGMVSKHQFSRKALNQLFARTEIKQQILDAISRPAESKPWSKYRPIFLTPERIERGVAFWRDNAELLRQAEEQYGVAAEVIVAIIGVETFYGRNTGSYRVVDALSTLGFNYPPRAKFFRSELEQFLVMAQEEGFDPLTLTGSYAGAMGMPQFIPSSFRNFAVDFDADGRRDLWHSKADVIGSVANYFHVHKWQLGERVAVPAQLAPGTDPTPLLDDGLELKRTVGELSAAGVEPQQELRVGQKAKLIALDGDAGTEYWIVLDNFYVITRYNRSPLYAMAVHQLSQQIREQYQKP